MFSWSALAFASDNLSVKLVISLYCLELMVLNPFNSLSLIAISSFAFLTCSVYTLASSVTFFVFATSSFFPFSAASNFFFKSSIYLIAS
jgi:hypothetical protein